MGEGGREIGVLSIYESLVGPVRHLVLLSLAGLRNRTMLTSFGMDAGVGRRYVLRQLYVVFVAHNISPV